MLDSVFIADPQSLIFFFSFCSLICLLLSFYSFSAGIMKEPTSQKVSFFMKEKELFLYKTNDSDLKLGLNLFFASFAFFFFFLVYLFILFFFSF